MKRILIVDDDYDICEALQLLLERRFEVSVAYNGQQALECLECQSFDAVVLDLMMPVMDGEELMQRLGQRGIRTPVIFASAATHLPARARSAGAAAWLTKPFEATQLENTLDRILDGSDGGGESGGPRSGSSGVLKGSGGPSACPQGLATSAAQGLARPGRGLHLGGAGAWHCRAHKDGFLHPMGTQRARPAIPAGAFHLEDPHDAVRI